jgi:zinc protease
MELSHRARAVLCAFLVASFPFAASAKPSDIPGTGITRATLKNGLRVVIVKDALAPVVSTAMDYLVGSEEAPSAFPGMAHAQEHMMFRGGQRLNADQLADIAGLMGGDFNADTSENLTRYLFTVPATDLDVALHIEAARMADIADDRRGWDQEKGAIEQEVAEDVSDPEYVVDQRLRSQLFHGSPYEKDALGNRFSFDHTTAGMLKSFHDTWYTPNNAILFVVGNVHPQMALDKIRALFEPIGSKRLPPRPKFNLAPVNTAPIIVQGNRPTLTRMLAIRLPGLNSPDYPAIELLADILSSQRFALYDLVSSGRVLNADFSLNPMVHASYATAAITVLPRRDVQSEERALRKILDTVARNGVPADLFAAAKLQEKRAMEFRKNSISNLTEQWSDAVAEDGLESPEAGLRRIQNVSLSQVNRVARKYLDFGNAVSVTVTPSAGSRAVRADHHQAAKTETINLHEPKPVVLPDWARSTLTQLDTGPTQLHPDVFTLSNGLTLIVQPESVSDTVSIYGHIKNRPETEAPKGKEGVAQVLAALFSYGSERRSRLQFQRALDDIGAEEHSGMDFSIATISSEFERGVSLLAENELHPALPAGAMRTIRDQLRDVVAERAYSPGYLANAAMRQSLFPKDDPALREAVPQTIAPLSPADIRAYYATTVRPDLTTIVVVGNIAPAKARAVIEKYFGHWRSVGPRPLTDLPEAPSNRSTVIAVTDGSKLQDSVDLAETFALPRTNPDYYALQLGNAVLAGGFYSSRLTVDLRKKRGLVYSVDAGLQSGSSRSVFSVRYACDPANVGTVAQVVTQELSTMRSRPVSRDELDRAKAFLSREMVLGQSSVGDVANNFNHMRDLNLPLNEPNVAAARYASLNSKDVQSAFRKWIRPENLVRVSEGPVPR